jgi:hypothetical protein
VGGAGGGLTRAGEGPPELHADRHKAPTCDGVADGGGRVRDRDEQGKRKGWGG